MRLIRIIYNQNNINTIIITVIEKGELITFFIDILILKIEYYCSFCKASCLMIR